MRTSRHIEAKKHSNVSFDILKQEKRYMLQISESIAGRFPQVSRAEIDARVVQRYEGLLATAKVYTHIPSLIEGQVGSEFRRKYSS